MSEINHGLQIIVDWETVDQIMEQNLIDTYKHLIGDIKRLKKKKNLQDYEKEDLEHNEKVLAALDIIGDYYVYDFKKKVKKK